MVRITVVISGEGACRLETLMRRQNLEWGQELVLFEPDSGSITAKITGV